MKRYAGALFAVIVALTAAAPAAAEQASSALLPVQAGALDLGQDHSCLVFDGARIRCWGEGADGRLGYGDTERIGDNEEPYYVERPELGPHFLEAVTLGGPVRAVSAGEQHTCALYDDLELGDGRIACWGYGASGRLGYGDTESIGDDEWARDAAGPVDVGGAAKAVSAGGKHTCAVLVGGQVRCWGTIATGRLTYDNTSVIGDDEVPAEVAPVPLGGTAVTVVTGWVHSCALLVGGQVKCWGESGSGQLGYGFRPLFPPYEYPDEVDPVRLGGKAVALAAGSTHTCALLESAEVRCWGSGQAGRLGYGNEETIGDDEHPDEVEPVRIGGDAMAIAAGAGHSCALLTTGQVRCWGYGGFGEMGTGTKEAIGNDEHPDQGEPVRLGGTAVAIAAGSTHDCALLVNGQLRCWGGAGAGKLGYGNVENIGDDELPEDAGSVDFGGDSLLHSTSDLALTLQATPAGPTVGAPVTVTATVVNAGPYAQPRTRVRVDLPAALEPAAASAPGGGFLGNVWSLPALLPGQSAKLTLATTTLTPGAALIAAEVTAATLPDPDSAPGNGEAGEDDLAFASITATVPPAPEATKSPEPTPRPEPQTRIGKVAQRGKRMQAVARFAADEPVRKFICRLDGGAAFKCASPRVLARLSPGWHLLAVTAVNVAGVPDPTPALRRFRIRGG